VGETLHLAFHPYRIHAHPEKSPTMTKKHHWQQQRGIY